MLGAAGSCGRRWPQRGRHPVRGIVVEAPRPVARRGLEHRGVGPSAAHAMTDVLEEPVLVGIADRLAVLAQGECPQRPLALTLVAWLTCVLPMLQCK